MAEINAMVRDPAAWLGSLVRRSEAEIETMSECLSFWRHRVRGRPKAGRRILPPFVRDSVASTLQRSLLDPGQVPQGDVLAHGRPFFALDVDLQDEIWSAVTERSRAIGWITKTFDDWWSPGFDD